MWCANCQSDVAGEVSPDAKSLLCTTCGGEVSSIKAPGCLPQSSGVRELLDRWNAEELLDPYQPSRCARNPESTTAGIASDSLTETDIEGSERPFRTDPPDQGNTSDSSEPDLEFGDDTMETPRESRVARRPPQRSFRVDRSHAPADADHRSVPAPHEPRDVDVAPDGRVHGAHDQAPSPHFNLSSAFDERRKPGRIETLWGQLLAYGGVGVLTVGTGLVVWGYFGGPENYTPTGWLLATAGQMLLFLGVVTLISGGLEQNTHEVTQRIERLGDQIVRIERHTAEQSLRGPHFATGVTSDRRQTEALASDEPT